MRLIRVTARAVRHPIPLSQLALDLGTRLGPYEMRFIRPSAGDAYTPINESPLYRGIRVGGQAAQLPSCVGEVGYDADGHLLPNRLARERFRGEAIRTG